MLIQHLNRLKMILIIFWHHNVQMINLSGAHSNRVMLNGYVIMKIEYAFTAHNPWHIESDCTCWNSYLNC